jgi:hypothetical protein
MWGHGAAEETVGLALGGNHKQSKIPKQGDSGAHKQKP